MRYAPIAQLDRVTDYESVGRGFESLSAYQINTRNLRIPGVFLRFHELFCDKAFGETDRVTDLLLTAKGFSFIACTALTKSSACRCV